MKSLVVLLCLSLVGCTLSIHIPSPYPERGRPVQEERK